MRFDKNFLTRFSRTIGPPWLRAIPTHFPDLRLGHFIVTFELAILRER